MDDVEDRRQVAALLGRAPQGAFTVVVRHADGSPVVIENAPLLDDGTPMPTRWWLVGEPERTWIGRLEADAGVVRAEAAVDAAALADAHDRYRAERDARIPASHDGPRPFGGVGGTRRGVKCLHAHYAWWLAGGDDPVGAWVATQLAAQGLRSEGDTRRPATGPVAGPVAAIDCGTNSTRLLVADRDETGAIVTLQRTMRITRLGQGVDATGRLAPEAIRRTLDVLGEYRAAMDHHGVTAVRATATSAARDAANRDDFFGPAAEVLGADLELLSGVEEGNLSFAGATADLTDRPGSYLVVDLGGGSTEFAFGSLDADGGQRLHDAVSVDLGCVRITERFLADDPPTPDQIVAASAHCDEIIAGALDRIDGARDADVLVGLAGTVSTLAAIDLGLGAYDRSRTHHHLLTTERVTGTTRMLLGLPAEQRRSIPGMEPGRIEVIAGGLVVLTAVLRATGQDRLLVSESDILDGLAASLLPPHR